MSEEMSRERVRVVGASLLVLLIATLELRGAEGISANPTRSAPLDEGRTGAGDHALRESRVETIDGTLHLLIPAPPYSDREKVCVDQATAWYASARYLESVEAGSPDEKLFQEALRAIEQGKRHGPHEYAPDQMYSAFENLFTAMTKQERHAEALRWAIAQDEWCSAPFLAEYRTAGRFSLGLAHYRVGNWADAARAFSGKLNTSARHSVLCYMVSCQQRLGDPWAMRDAIAQLLFDEMNALAYIVRTLTTKSVLTVNGKDGRQETQLAHRSDVADHASLTDDGWADITYAVREAASNEFRSKMDSYLDRWVSAGKGLASQPSFDVAERNDPGVRSDVETASPKSVEPHLLRELDELIRILRCAQSTRIFVQTREQYRTGWPPYQDRRFVAADDEDTLDLLRAEGWEDVTESTCRYQIDIARVRLHRYLDLWVAAGSENGDEHNTSR